MPNFGEPTREMKPKIDTGSKLQMFIKDIAKVKNTPNGKMKMEDIVPGAKFFGDITPKTVDQIQNSLGENFPDVGRDLLAVSIEIRKGAVDKMLKLTGANTVSDFQFGKLHGRSEAELVDFGLELARAESAAILGGVLSLRSGTISGEERVKIINDVVRNIKLNQAIMPSLYKDLSSLQDYKDGKFVHDSDAFSPSRVLNKEQVAFLATQSIDELSKRAGVESLDYRLPLTSDTKILLENALDSKLYSPETMSAMEHLSRLPPSNKELSITNQPFIVIVDRLQRE